MAEHALPGIPLESMSATEDGSIWVRTADDVRVWKFPSPPWVAMPENVGAAPESIGVASDGTVYAVDVNRLVRTFVAGAWIATPNQPPLAARVSVGSVNNVWVCGESGALFRLAAGNWLSADLPVAARAVCACSDGAVFALDIQGRIYWGRPSAVLWEWFPVPNQLPGADRIAAGHAGFLWARGTGGWFQWRPQGWVPRPATQVLDKVVCCNDGWAFTTSATHLWFFSPQVSKWLQGQPLPAGGNVTDLTAGDQRQIWAIQGGKPYEAVTAYNPNVPWEHHPFSSRELAAVDATSMYAVRSGDGHVVHNQGAGWNPQDVGVGRWSTVAAASDGTVCALNEQDARPYKLEDPATNDWRAMPPAPGEEQFVMLAAGGAQRICALARSGRVYRYDSAPSGWSPLPSFQSRSHAQLTQISVSTEGFLYGVSSAKRLCAYMHRVGPASEGAEQAGLHGRPIKDWWEYEDFQTRWISAANVWLTWALSPDQPTVELLESPPPGPPYPPLEPRARLARRAPSDGAPGWEVESVFDETASTHLWIVNRAARLAGEQGQGPGGRVRDLLRPFQGQLNDPFHDRLCQGLRDADYVREWNEEVIPGVPETALYASHFYDPDTGRNWLGMTSPTALERAAVLGEEAAEHYISGELAEAGYKLGLALHYATDLTQPMHTANLTFLSSFWVGWHSAFEAYTMVAQASIEGGFQYRPPAPEATLADILYETAASAKTMATKVWPKAVTRGYRISISRQEAIDEVDEHIEPILRNAVTRTATFLVAWMELAESVGKESPWTIVHVRAGLAMTGAGGKVQLSRFGGGSNQQWALIRVPGTSDVYTVSCLSGGKVLDVDKGSMEPGAGICLWSAKSRDNDNQHWRVRQLPRGAWLENVRSRLAMTVSTFQENAKFTQEQPNHHADTQLFWFEQFTRARIVLARRDAENQQMAIDVPHGKRDPNLAVQVFPAWSGGHSNQQWLFVEIDDPSAGDAAFAIVSFASGLVLGPGNVGPGPAEICQQVWTGAPSQRWELVALGRPRTYMLLNVDSGGAMAVGNDPPRREDPIYLAEASGASPVRWIVEPLPR